MTTRHVPQEVKTRVEQKILDCIAIAESEYGRTFDFPKIRYDLRGKTAGWAKCWNNEINLNSVLLMENLDSFIERTVVHEFAHIVDGIMNPETRETNVTFTRTGRIRRTKRSVHGPTWKAIMRMFGADPSRCHSYDVSNATVKKSTRAKHVWVCGCGEAKMKLGAKRHQRQLKSAPFYMRGHTVRRCGKYSYLGVEGAELKPMPLFKTERPKPAPVDLPKAADAPKPTVNLGEVTALEALSKGLNKRELAMAIYKLRNGDVDRQGMIKLFMEHLDMSKAGASTYYYNTKKQYEAEGRA